MATIRDVARTAGVSISTVSAILNGTARVSEKLTRRVRQAIEATGYSRDGVARSLRLGRTSSIGLVVGDISNPFFTSLAKAVETRASEAGYLVIVANTDEQPDRELKLLTLLREQRVAGIILAPAGHDDDYLSALSLLKNSPVVLIDRHLPDTGFESVSVDNVAAAKMVTDYLVRLNHRRIAIVLGKQHLWTTEQRLRGFHDSLAAAGICPDSTLELSADSRIESAYDAVQHLLNLPNRPTAIFAANNLMMLGAIEAIMDMGFRCPEDVSLAGIDDFPWISAIRPQLTTVAQPIKELGKVSVELLLDQIRDRIRQDAGQDCERKVRVLEPRLLIRGSCARLSAETHKDSLDSAQQRSPSEGQRRR